MESDSRGLEERSLLFMLMTEGYDKKLYYGALSACALRSE